METWDARSIEQQGEFIDFEDLVTGTRGVEVAMFGRAFRVDYDPNAYDDALQLQIEQMLKLPDGDPRRVKFADTVILRLAKSWNLRGKDGSMTPIDEASLARISNPLRQRIAGAISSDLWGSATDAGPKSSGGSSDSSAEEVAAAVNGKEPDPLAGSSFTRPPGF